jgi:hypothetical protein
MPEAPRADVLEDVEANFMYQYVSTAPATVIDTLRTSIERMGGGVVLAMRNDPAGYWNKALGFGFTEPVTRELIARVIAFYEAAQSPAAVIQIAPAALPADWHEICAHHALLEDSKWAKLACAADEFRPVETTTLHIARVESGDVDRWARTTLQGLGMPQDGLSEMFASSAHSPAFRPFAAWDGDQMVAAANLFVHGEVASLNAGATLASHRNRGAQSALIAARGKEAIKAGCRWLVAEAGQPGPGEVNPSLRNLMRSGLRMQYLRTNWLWRGRDGRTPGD